MNSFGRLFGGDALEFYSLFTSENIKDFSRITRVTGNGKQAPKTGRETFFTKSKNYK